MRLFTNIFLANMETRQPTKGIFHLGAFLVLVVLLNLSVADARSHIPARVLAKQTGATQFEEHYETQADCNEHKHSLRKRASDEDVDYEVYQGVVGRPGIDFPIYPRIPKTSFSCRTYGNGYFADMETDCQVFHICEEGRKISFLCPNGTIFQQSELTCDWWFKVNCLGSSSFYGESSELLGKQRDQHLKPVVPVQGFNIVGGGLNIKPRVPAKSTGRSRDGINIDADVSGKIGRNGAGGAVGSGNAKSVGPQRKASGDATYVTGKATGSPRSGGTNGYADATYGKGKTTSGSPRSGGNNGGDASYSSGGKGPNANSESYGDNKRGPTTSNDKYRDGNRGPSASNEKYRDSNRGPVTSNDKYRDGNRGPDASNDKYRDDNRGPDASNEKYRDGNRGPDASNEKYRDGNRGPDGSNEYYRDGSSGPSGDSYREGNNGPENENYRSGSQGPNGPSGDSYLVGNDGPENENYRSGSKGPNGPSGDSYKTGKDGPSNENYRTGPNADSYKTGKDGPTNENYRSGGNGPSGPSSVKYKVGKNGPSSKQSPSGSNGKTVGSSSSDLNGPGGHSSYKYQTSGVGTDFGASTSASHEYPSINKPERRIDSAEMPSIESVDFEDLSSEKSKSEITVITSNDNEDESQMTAETASFVYDGNRNSYDTKKKTQQVSAKDAKSQGKSADEVRSRGSGDRGSQRHGYVNLNSETTEKARSSSRGNQRYREDKTSQDQTNSDEKTNKKQKYSGAGENKKEKFVVDTGVPHPTPSYVSGTYTTARRIESTRTTPFYTPTVPPVTKGKTNNEGKSKEATATTPSPHRFSVGNQGSGLFLEGEKKDHVKPTTNSRTSQVSEATTLRSIVIGMRHDYGELPRNHKYYEADIESVETTTPATTGPTYLPKSSESSSSKLSQGSSGDSLLFAPATDVEVSRNVNEMLKTMDVIKHNFQDVELIKQSSGNGSNRQGLDIPPSSGPDALVSLAKYFATEQNESLSNKNLNALGGGEDKDKKSEVKGKSDILSSGVIRKTEHHGSSTSTNSLAPKDKPSDTTATLTTESSASLAPNADDIATGLLSNKTVRKYNKLFGLDNGETGEEENKEGKLRTDASQAKSPASQTGVTSFPQIGPTDATIRTLAQKPESRKIAQVFSNALNDYLNDPVKFRDELRSQARPTEPPFANGFVSVTDSSLFNHGTAATYLPTLAPTTIRPYSTTESNLASDINSHLITSTGYPDSELTTNVFDATTFKSSGERKSSNLEFSAELEPPNSGDSGEGEELLRGEHTESFAKNNKQTEKSGKLSFSKPQKSWSFIEEDDVLDPLKINDGLMKKTTYQPKIQQQTKVAAVEGQSRSPASSISALSSSPITTSAEFNQRGGQSGQYKVPSEDPWGELFDAYDISKENLPATTGLQRIANKLFGGLNETEALHLKNVMAEAEHNRQILRLLLLLIQTCDDHNGKALERSRKSLLGALISMDGKLQSSGKGKSSRAHGTQQTLTTTEKLPVTTYRRTGSGEEFTTTTLSYGATDEPATTTTVSGITTTTDAAASGNSAEATTKFAIIVDDFGGESAATTTTESGATSAAAGSSSPGSLDGNADKRALELLKSLYSLASKFTSRR
ncbi:chitin-binding domain protein thawb [Musca autumnalis]|uniref:chitin-binding domain protein thawb n=1 Tax=Musca autumnalis TaxID=221902 RepID=UPI003CF3BEFC